MTRVVLIFLGMIALTAMSRLLPHPPNFTPLIAIALFSGALLKNRPVLAYVVPLGAMVISDFFIGFHSLSGVVYLSMVPAVWVGQFANKDSGEARRVKFFGRWFGLGIVADLFFFVMSNLGVWWLSGYYEHSLAGLSQCFVLALPFLLNQVLGTTTFLGLLLFSWYGLMVLAQRRLPNFDPIKVRK